MGKIINNYAFIDSQNLNLSIRDQGWALDFKRFRKYLEDKYGVTKAFIFNRISKLQSSRYYHRRWRLSLPYRVSQKTEKVKETYSTEPT
ncbi:MAG: hypothetical protein PHW54_06800 [Candidatus Omnitrophica bacterium]|nr:hypothetical protein [Candidatus Omnitrophota bacterium]